MAASTGIVLTAGGVSLLDHIVSGEFSAPDAMRITVATIGAAVVGAGLDKAAKGLGTGLAVVLLVAVIAKSGPRIVDRFR